MLRICSIGSTKFYCAPVHMYLTLAQNFKPHIQGIIKLKTNWIKTGKSIWNLMIILEHTSCHLVKPLIEKSVVRHNSYRCRL